MKLSESGAPLTSASSSFETLLVRLGSYAERHWEIGPTKFWQPVKTSGKRKAIVGTRRTDIEG
jgi:hypothetical protein